MEFIHFIERTRQAVLDGKKLLNAMVAASTDTNQAVNVVHIVSAFEALRPWMQCDIFTWQRTMSAATIAETLTKIIDDYDPDNY